MSPYPFPGVEAKFDIKMKETDTTVALYQRQEEERKNRRKNIVAIAVPALAVTAVGIFAACRIKVAKPHEYLVRTGVGIQDIHVSRKAVQWPFQRIAAIDLRPSSYNFTLHNMSKEKVEFRLPVNFTIGPIDPLQNVEGFKLYAQRMNDMDNETLSQTVLGIVEGETRGLTSVLSVEEMFPPKNGSEKKS
jgi:flotillin